MPNSDIHDQTRPEIRVQGVRREVLELDMQIVEDVEFDMFILRMAIRKPALMVVADDSHEYPMQVQLLIFSLTRLQTQSCS